VVGLEELKVFHSDLKCVAQYIKSCLEKWDSLDADKKRFRLHLIYLLLHSLQHDLMHHLLNEYPLE